MLDAREHRYFIAVAEELSFAAAADRLDLAQSTVSLRWGRHRHPLLERVDECPCGLEVDGVEALGKPIVDWSEERHRVGASALIAQ